MTKPLAVLVVAVLASACGGGPCKARSGNYSIKLVHRDGTCGVLSEQIGPVDDVTPPAQLGCTGTRTKSEDNCEVTANQLSCGGGAALTGTIRWNADSTKATGTGSISAPSCYGTYDVTYTKL